MTVVAVSQRVVCGHGSERRDGLDQRWPAFLAACGLIALPVPNRAEVAVTLAEVAGAVGVLLTGGGDIGAVGGADTDRDETEECLIDWAQHRDRPILGVCRGMQVIQARCGVPLVRIDGHVADNQTIDIDSRPRTVNSYHDWGTTETVDDLAVWARSADGVVKAVRHRRAPITGIMWHPERLDPFATADIGLFRVCFRAAPCGG